MQARLKFSTAGCYKQSQLIYSVTQVFLSVATYQKLLDLCYGSHCTGLWVSLYWKQQQDQALADEELGLVEKVHCKAAA